MANYIDFAGFTFNGVHTSEISPNLYRVSSSSRYTEDLVPTFKDTTSDKVGSDGTFFWDSFYTKKDIPVEVAFDHMTELEFRHLRQWLANDKQRAELIFDEKPYKAYTVKITSPPQFKYLCFDELDKSSGKMIRVYKGEGSIKFTCYGGYANGTVKSEEDIYVDLNTEPKEFKNSIYSNYNEWKDSIKLPESLNPNQICNCGDTPCAPIIYIKEDNNALPETLKIIRDNDNNDILMELNIVRPNTSVLPSLDNASYYLCIDCEKALVYYATNNDGKFAFVTRSICNDFITKGDFFTIPYNKNLNIDSNKFNVDFTNINDGIISITTEFISTSNRVFVDYNLLYF